MDQDFQTTLEVESAGVQSTFSSLRNLGCQKINIADVIFVAVAFTLLAMVVTQICQMLAYGLGIQRGENSQNRSGSRSGSRSGNGSGSRTGNGSGSRCGNGSGSRGRSGSRSGSGSRSRSRSRC